MRIHRQEFIDGFYRLWTMVDGKEISVTYSDTTNINEAIKDFEKTIKEARQTVCRTQ